MGLDARKNFAKSTVSTGYDASATSIVLQTGHGAKLPAVPFNATWHNASDYPDPSDDPNVEIVRVTGVSTDTLTITRAQEGTAASTKNTSGKTYRLIATITKKTLDDLNDARWELISTQNVSSAAEVVFSDLSSVYSEFEIVIRRVTPASGSSDFLLAALSTNNGTSYLSSGYSHSKTGQTTDAGSIADAQKNQPYLSIGIGGGAITGRLRIYEPATAAPCVLAWDLTTTRSGGEWSYHVGGGRNSGTTAVNAIKFYFLLGNIASGTFLLFGRRA